MTGLYGNLDAGSNAVLIQTLTIAHEGMMTYYARPVNIGTDVFIPTNYGLTTNEDGRVGSWRGDLL